MGTPPSIPDLLTQIEAVLGPAISPSLSAASAASDVFEAYVLTIILQAAEIEDAIVQFQNVDGSTPTIYTFRTSPGHIWSNVQPYTHAVLTFPNQLPQLEVHTGVYVSGKSGLIHEADVLVLLSEEAELARQNQVPPRSYKTFVATECKFYAANLGLGLARGFLGLCSDLSSLECFFITNSNSNSVEKLLNHKRRKWETSLQPSETVVVERFRNAIQDVFKQFKVTYRA